MKILSVFLSVLVVLALACTGYLYTSCAMRVTDVSLTVSEAAERTVSTFRQQLSLDAFPGLSYGRDLTGEAQDYVSMTYTVSLSNTCFLPADMIELQVIPQEGDVLQFPDHAPHMLPARSASDFSVSLLAPRDSLPAREIRITYSMWGIPFFLHTRYA